MLGRGRGGGGGGGGGGEERRAQAQASSRLRVIEAIYFYTRWKLLSYCCTSNILCLRVCAFFCLSVCAMCVCLRVVAGRFRLLKQAVVVDLAKSGHSKRRMRVVEEKTS